MDTLTIASQEERQSMLGNIAGNSAEPTAICGACACECVCSCSACGSCSVCACECAD